MSGEGTRTAKWSAPIPDPTVTPLWRPIPALLHASQDITSLSAGQNSLKRLTVMFVSVTGFEKYASRVNPEESFRFLNEILSGAIPIIQACSQPQPGAPEGTRAGPDGCDCRYQRSPAESRKPCAPSVELSHPAPHYPKANKGIVDKLMGDKFMVFFSNADKSLKAPTHPERPPPPPPPRSRPLLRTRTRRLTPATRCLTMLQE